MVFCTLLILLETLPSLAAPAPDFSKHNTRPITRSYLVGVWDAKWGDVSCVITLSEDGQYKCRWSGSDYTGTWSWRSEKLWVSEKSQLFLGPTTWKWIGGQLVRRGDVISGRAFVSPSLSTSYDLEMKKR